MDKIETYLSMLPTDMHNEILKHVQKDLINDLTERNAILIQHLWELENQMKINCDRNLRQMHDIKERYEKELDDIKKEYQSTIYKDKLNKLFGLNRKFN